MTLPHEILTLQEVAEYLRIPAATLYRQRYVGVKPGSLGFRCGRHVRYRRSDLEAWLDAHASALVARDTP